MTRLRGLLLLCLLWAAPVFAQSEARIQWRHDGLNVTYFTLVVDGGTATSLGLPTPVSANTYQATLVGQAAWENAARGQHAVLIQACNANGCTSSGTIIVVKL